MNTTTGQALTATLRKSFRINSRTRDYRDGGSIKRDMLDSIRNAVVYPGYYGAERTELSRAAWGTLAAYDKHVEGFRIAGELRFQIVSMSPYAFAAFIGRMVDAGVTNCGEGERFFNNMTRELHAAA